MANFHIAMYPWYAAGHIIPYIHLANELATRGHRISFLLPKNTQTQFQHLIDLHHQNLITFHPITVPHVDGLPPGTELVSDIPLPLNHELAIAMDLTRDQVKRVLISAKPDLVFHDFAYWVPEIANELRIKSVCYHIFSATAMAYGFVPAKYVPRDRPITEEEVRVPPDGYPSSVVVPRGHEARSLFSLTRPFGEGKILFYERLTASMRNCDALAIRTCRELEGKYCDYIESQYGKPVLLTGSALPESENTVLEDRWAKWLSGFEPGSVVFCSFGSQYILEKEQFQELVLGIEQSGQPFFIALKPPVGCQTVEEGLPERFEDRVKGTGVVYGGWVQQPQMLSHPSVGCFVNHCGSGSVWESLMSDNQIVFLPRFGDQTLYSKLFAQELKVAVSVEKDENGWFPKDRLSKAIKSVMDKDSKVGIMVKNNHANLKKVLGQPGFMSGYIDRFVHNLQVLVNPII
ncbi:hypothetical protein FEM48_Zijuj12G0108300 [Ziziphus jujuba var. spinosa]|uniref:Uncharacterized protein n=1 Tax=Ziziphus jujuba var. spinosa TaxID=714518 RepID=A0A978UCW1_ZIZJJ|nr:hypothetical protein FEM48_Zijuj12G0108300 [Ziziphus jujuba var. spinosa]